MSFVNDPWEVPEITRVEVIDERGRVLTIRHNESLGVALSEQDGGRTLKIFLNKARIGKSHIAARVKE